MGLTDDVSEEKESGRGVRIKRRWGYLKSSTDPTGLKRRIL